MGKATYADVLAAPDHVVAEVVSGVLYTHARPRVAHAVSMLRLGSLLHAAHDRTDDPEGWVFMAEPELHLGEDVIVPDLAGWRRDRMPELPLEAPGVRLAPDWVCEALSPSTATVDRTVKLPRYADVGVSWAWLLDPTARCLEAYRRASPLWELVATHGPDDVMACPPFPSVRFSWHDLLG